MNDEEAHVVSTHIRFDRAAKQREENKEFARATNEKIMRDKRLIAAVLKDLKTNTNKKDIARKHRIPHFSVIHIWRSTCAK